VTYRVVRPEMPSTTRLSLVNVPVLSKQHTSTLPANGILNGSVQNTSRMHAHRYADNSELAEQWR